MRENSLRKHRKTEDSRDTQVPRLFCRFKEITNPGHADAPAVLLSQRDNKPGTRARTWPFSAVLCASEICACRASHSGSLIVFILSSYSGSLTDFARFSHSSSLFCTVSCAADLSIPKKFPGIDLKSPAGNTVLLVCARIAYICASAAEKKTKKIDRNITMM